MAPHCQSLFIVFGRAEGKTGSRLCYTDPLAGKGKEHGGEGGGGPAAAGEPAPHQGPAAGEQGDGGQGAAAGGQADGGQGAAAG